VSNPSALGAICYESESSWAEDITTFATYRVSNRGPVDCSGLEHAKEDAGRTEQYRNAGSQHVLMTQGGSFKMLLDLTGHGSTMVGSPTLSARETLLGIVFGNVALSASASTTLTGGTAAVPTTTASGTFSAGGLCRIGTLGDTDGNGQMFSIATHVTTSLTLHGALDGAPQNGAVLYPVAQMYPSSSPTSTSITGTRFLLQTANLQYECHGCYPMSASFSGLNTGERPTVEITWGVSWWRYSTATFPSAVSSDTFNPSPVAAGSFNVQTVATTTRNTRSVRGVSIEYTLGIVPLMGPGGVSAYQKTVGATRVDDKCRISWTEDADAATTSPVLPGYGTATNSKHIEYTLSTTDGSAVGFKFPNVCVDAVPIQKDDGGINRLSCSGMAYTSSTTTNALTLAHMVLGFA
jgi:hypothetical protein